MTFDTVLICKGWSIADRDVIRIVQLGLQSLGIGEFFIGWSLLLKLNLYAGSAYTSRDIMLLMHVCCAHVCIKADLTDAAVAGI